MPILEWTAEHSDHGRRLDVYIAGHAGITRSRAEALIRGGRLTADGVAEKKPGFKVKQGMRFALDIQEPTPASARPQGELPLRVMYQDDDLAVVYKPSGMVVHPASGNPDGTLVNALLARLEGLSGIGGELRPGIVHRLDKDTSGLLLVAKHDRSHIFLSEQLKARAVERVYWAIIQGALSKMAGEIDAPIGRHAIHRKRMAICPNGREAKTYYNVMEELRGASLIEARLLTGRTHQIRVHMAFIGHPVLGDAVYGPKKPSYDVHGGQLLHARGLSFIHPSTGECMAFEAQPEKRFSDWLEILKL